MEYDDLVEFYKRKLRERYMMCDPERRRVMELICRANAETVGEVINLLEQKGDKLIVLEERRECKK